MLIVSVIGVLILSSIASPVPKCCDKNSEIRETDLVLTCDNNRTNARLDYFVEDVHFLNRSIDGECVDSNAKDLFKYEVQVRSNKSIILSKEQVPANAKCCPLNYIYNTKYHSCTPNEEYTLDEGIAVRIGLPDCQIIIDDLFKTYKDADEFSKNLTKGHFCLDKTTNDQFVVRKCQSILNICEEKKCLKKCCPDGQSYIGGAICKDTLIYGLRVDGHWYSSNIEDVDDDDYQLIFGFGCPKVSLVKPNKMVFNITKRGSYNYLHNYNKTYIEHHYSQSSSYCFEHAQKGSISGYNMFLCIPEREKIQEKFTSTLWAKILSCIFLVVTVLIYFLLGEVKSIFGKILVNYCVVMVLLMALLSVLHTKLYWGLQCKLIGYALLFVDMSAFAWVNIMSIDIWMTFGSFYGGYLYVQLILNRTPKRTIGNDQRRKEVKKCIIYLAYGYGMPICHGLLVFMFENTSVLPETFQPRVGLYHCFLENGNKARIVFFLVPQLILQLINTILFIRTITYCIKVKNEIARMNDLSRNKERQWINIDTERLGLLVKLAIIMGIIWIFEVITAFLDMKSYSEFSKNFEIFLDTLISLQGVFIFLIFVCKKKTFDSMKEKLGIGGRRTSNSLSQSSVLNGHYPMAKRQTTMSLTDSKI